MRNLFISGVGSLLAILMFGGIDRWSLLTAVGLFIVGVVIGFLLGPYPRRSQ